MMQELLDYMKKELQMGPTFLYTSMIALLTPKALAWVERIILNGPIRAIPNRNWNHGPLKPKANVLPMSYADPYVPQALKQVANLSCSPCTFVDAYLCLPAYLSQFFLFPFLFSNIYSIS